MATFGIKKNKKPHTIGDERVAQGRNNYLRVHLQPEQQGGPCFMFPNGGLYSHQKSSQLHKGVALNQERREGAYVR